MVRYWLHVNHPTNKARIHIEGGCSRVRKAVERKMQGKAYGDFRGDRNGYWAGPFFTLQDAQKVQAATGKKIQDKCSFCFSEKSFFVTPTLDKKQRS